MDFTALVNPDAGGWAAFVVMVVSIVTAIARGWLVPKRTVDQLTEAAARVDAVQAERLADSIAREAEWKASWVTERARGDLQSDQVGELLEQGRVTVTALEGLKRAARGDTP